MSHTATTMATARLTLRPLVIEDFKAFRGYAMSGRTRFVGGPVDEASAFDKFAAMVGHWKLRGFGRYAIALGGKAIGHAGPILRADYDVPEMTWTLWDGKREGKGYATEAAARIVTHLLGDLGWTDLIARIEPDNAASHAVAAKLGAIPFPEAVPPVWFAGAVTYRFAGPEAAR